MLRIRKKNGVSIVEVVVTAIIFSIAAFGVFSTIAVLRPQGQDSMKKLQALYTGKSILDELIMAVDAHTWGSGLSNLALGHHSRVIGNYTINYYVADVTGQGLRQVYMNVSYPD
ncbi:MAG: hypothetical protein K8S27_02380 [Candidatus Omnitrophica bacterium]|nr:hypothetical protein [Candidatus Omnitrophota bacterium]